MNQEDSAVPETQIPVKLVLDQFAQMCAAKDAEIAQLRAQIVHMHNSKKEVQSDGVA